MINCYVKTITGYEWRKAYSPAEYHAQEKKYTKKYCETFLTFDIETSTYAYIQDTMKELTYQSFMYLWQIGIEDDVIIGRTWDELLEFLNRVYFEFGDDKKIVIYVHNLAYEWQFMKTFFEWKDVFAIDDHVVLKCATDKFEFRCSYKLSNMNLEKFVENTPGHYLIKGKDDLDYKKLRTPSTPLTPKEYGYAYNDVGALWHAINHLLKEDTLESIPITSTGYVRRECRLACRNKEDRKTFKSSILDMTMYNLCIDAFRGGNTASNRYLCNMIIDNVHSFDIASSYPYVMMSCEFPHGKFMYTSIKSIGELTKYNKKFCTLGRYIFKNIRLKDINEPVPYLSFSKCQKADKNSLCYNGRVMESEYIETALTNIDFDIVNRMYDYDELYVYDFHFARKRLLSKELRKTIMKYFTDKTMLKDVEGQEYFYSRQKNKLNAIYGMCVSHILRDTYRYDSITHTISMIEAGDEDRQKEMDKYNDSWNSFLCFQWGVFVTAYARARLQQAIDIIGTDVVYCDTDSVKYIGDHDMELEALNREVIDNEKYVDIPYHVVRDGEKVYMGVWDKEKDYERFITLGAKKYAYEQYDKKGNLKLGVTVSGLSKENAPKELEEKGGLEAFTIGTIFHNAGRVSAKYVDCNTHYITVNGEDIKTGSYVSLLDTTYTLGITDTMLNIINTCQA